jgi:hypothetical protein
VGERRKAGGSVPFGVHQVVEYLLGGFALASVARVEPDAVPLCAGAGAGLIVLAALSGGRPGVVSLLGPRLHRVVDYVVAVALATCPWWSGVGWSAGGVWIVAALAVAMVWLTRATVYRRPVREEPPPVERTASPPRDGLAVTARTAGRLAGAIGRKGPRAAGVAVGRMKKKRPS